jgi:hypothetical protein
MNINFNEQKKVCNITSNYNLQEDNIKNREYYINIKESYERNSKNILSCIYWLLFLEYLYRAIRNFLLR